MTVKHGDAEWLIEVKMLRRGDAVGAAREALAQLLAYRHFLYPNGHAHVRMLAVFNEDIGLACVGFLEEQNVASVWRDGTGWAGSPTAREAGLC
ncbi:hypothetical protein GCM10023191_012620 [Actinoallomurus oryzae]|uniref:Uncharacterized protein n=1 Tax=Actinoallomurus oryzae TaxID=502180 RepID=A0ABP8PFS6_9ACTN